MKQATIVAIILGALVLISVVQAVQLNTMKDKITDGGLSVSSGSSSTPTASSGGDKTIKSVPKSIENLPTMVGGC